MKIRIISDNREFMGSAVDIVRQIQYVGFGKDERGLDEYVAWLVEQVRSTEGIEIKVVGESEEERAKSFVQGILDCGLAVRV